MLDAIGVVAFAERTRRELRSTVVTSWSGHRLPPGSLNETYVR
jgi:hypothetical protein